MNVLNVHNLGKAYRIYKSEWHRFASWFGIPVKPIEEHWALRYVNFEINSGEAVGIVGLNGAGKSTLLKLITGTLKPTEGQVMVNGRIAAILELGMGFNPELTGRQNVFHAAGLMGFSTEQIQQVMSGIEEFAEIGDYFDEPMRTYSSGMYVRVAFAVATAWRPEILIVDEALSVGDAYFQHKSFNRIYEFREQGTTLLFVSHDKGAILALCDKAILLKSGKIDAQGSPSLIMDYYNAQLVKNREETVELPVPGGAEAVVSGNKKATIRDIAILNDDNHVVDSVGVGENIKLIMRVVISQDVSWLTLGYQIKDRLGQAIFGINTKYTDQVICDCKSGEEYEFVIRFRATLGPGTYSLSTTLVDTDGTILFENYEWNEFAAIFNVVNLSEDHFVGCAWMPPVIEIRKA